MNIRRYIKDLSIFALLVIAWYTTESNNALASCVASPQLFVGESALYRFTNTDDQVTNVTLRVISQEKYWYVIKGFIGDQRYYATVGTDCFDTGLPSDYVEPPYPSFYENPILVELLQPNVRPFRQGEYVKNSAFDQFDCNEFSDNYGPPLERTLRIRRCKVTASSATTVDGVISASTDVITLGAPISGLISKTVLLANGTTRTIELVRIGEQIPNDDRPHPVRFLNTLSYSDTALEIVWTRPADNRAISFEILRDAVSLGLTDGLSFYDANRSIQQNQIYTVVAIDAFGNRSVPLNILPGIYNYGFMGAFEAPEPIVLPAQILRAQVYSGTAAELFWAAPVQTKGAVTYVIVRNGVSIAVVDGLSYFDDSLQPGEHYQYDVTTLSLTGSRSATVSAQAITPHDPTRNPPDTNASPAFLLTTKTYSSTAAEIFWAFSRGGSTGQRNEIYRNGELFAQTNGFSYFTDELQAGTAYEFQVFSYGNGGRLDGASEVVTLTTPGGNVVSTAISVVGDTITWPKDGWYQVQRADNYDSICEGGTSCVVDDGVYTVINLTSGQRFEQIVVRGSNQGVAVD